MNRRFLLAMALLLVGLIGLSAPRLRSSEPDTFPHEKHAHLFPSSCKACHSIVTGQAEGRLVSATPADCARCHDGATVRRVNWQPREGGKPNLIFSHDLHVKENGLECSACHEPEGSEGGMTAKVHPTPETCLPCHDAKSHMEPGRDCSTCHKPLAAAPELTADQVSSFPVPDNHAEGNWGTEHGRLAQTDLQSCSICHARETCQACHLNARDVPAIQKLSNDTRVADQVAIISPSWPKPASHDSLWAAAHGPAARRNIESCATCHAQASCSGCHGAAGMAPSVVGRLPVPAAEAAQGVPLPGRRPPGHTPEFARTHGVAALVGSPRCAGCHDTREYCGQCHEAPKSPDFHPLGYMDRHAADVYSRDKDCASCHSTETFCRSCHQSSGLSTRNPKNSSYHDAQPLWLLNHGDAARQGMESCASCHQQKDCLRCHSAKTGWKINPHGPDFDARRLGDKSPMMCARCHFTTPVP